jgi:hypothetical protein
MPFLRCVVVRIGVVALGLAFVLAATRAAMVPDVSPPRSSATTLPASHLESEQSVPETAEPRIDRFGNEVNDAVGDYRIDSGGNVYESHSPETEITPLAAPRS